MEPIYLQNARVSFAHLAEPHASGPTSPPKYGCDLLLPINDPQVAAVQAHILAVGTEEFKEQAQQIITLSQGDRMLRSHGPGENKINNQTGQVLDGYAGHFFITATNKMMPQMVKADGTPVDPANMMEAQAVARSIYSGCYVNAAIKAWAQNNANGRTVRVELIAIQFARDGEPFGGDATPDVTHLFGAVQAPAGVPAAGGMAQPIGTPGMPQAAPAAPQPPFTPPGMQPPAGVPTPPPAPAQPAPVAPAAPVPGGLAPVQGADGRWYDPQTGQEVPAPTMPGYPT